MRFLRGWICIFCLLPLLAGGVSAAGGLVAKDGVAADYIENPDTMEFPTTLFGGFDHLCPGDMMMDRIRIRGSADLPAEVSIYLRSDSPDSPTRDYYLQQPVLDIRSASGRRVFYGTLEKTTQWVFLGTLSPGQQEMLELTLWVPAQAGETFREVMRTVNWRFLAVVDPLEETPVPDTPPATGDSPQPFALAAVLVCSSVGLRLLFRRRACR